ncbi:hypothetical protein CXR29_14020 [Brevibacterium linens]|nr:hypothetical protein CXR29_14020 [Brevibacterium linens]
MSSALNRLPVRTNSVAFVQPMRRWRLTDSSTEGMPMRTSGIEYQESLLPMRKSAADERTVAELADARYVLETTAVERASEPMRQRLAARLEEFIVEQRSAFAEADVARFIDLTLEFHRGFVEAGDNQVMLEMYALLSDRHRFSLFMISRRLLDRCDEIITEHEALVTHLRSGDSAAFAATLRGHIEENAGPTH